MLHTLNETNKPKNYEENKFTNKVARLLQTNGGLIMTVQELIEALNNIKDKSKEVLHYDYLPIEEIEENDYVVLC